jgi:hypothetical protein
VSVSKLVGNDAVVAVSEDTAIGDDDVFGGRVGGNRSFLHEANDGTAVKNLACCEGKESVRKRLRGKAGAVTVDDMLAIQVGRRNRGDEELRACRSREREKTQSEGEKAEMKSRLTVRVGTGVSHREEEGLLVLELEVWVRVKRLIRRIEPRGKGS